MSSLRAQSLKDILTFARASTATYVASSGLIASAAIDEPRIEHDPMLRTPRGLLMEEARTNHLLQSQEFDTASWSKTRCSVVPNWTYAPDGSATADQLVEDSTATQTHYVSQTLAKSASNEVQPYSVSVFVRAVGARTQIRLQVQGTSGTAHSAYALFDLSAVTAGAVTASGNFDNTQSRIERYANNWRRCILDFRINNDAQADVSVIVSMVSGGSVTYTGDGTSVIDIWGAQLEKGWHHTSYIPSTTAAVARLGDLCEAQSLIPWFDEDVGTIYAEYLLPWTHSAADSSTTRRIVQADDGNDNNSQLAATIGAGVRGGSTFYNSVQQASAALGSHAPDVVQKQAWAWAENNVAAAASGGYFVSDTSAYMPISLTNFRIGAAYQPNGYLRKVRYWPRRLADNELRALVA